MEKIPNMISTKDLSFIEDMFNWNFTVCKKAYNYSNLVTDENISKFLKMLQKNMKKFVIN